MFKYSYSARHYNKNPSFLVKAKLKTSGVPALLQPSNSPMETPAKLGRSRGKIVDTEVPIS